MGLSHECNFQSANALRNHWVQSFALSPTCEIVFHSWTHFFSFMCPCTPQLVVNLMLKLQQVLFGKILLKRSKVCETRSLVQWIVCYSRQWKCMGRSTLLFEHTSWIPNIWLSNKNKGTQKEELQCTRWAFLVWKTNWKNRLEQA